MIAASLHRPVAVTMFYVGIVILGIVSYQNISVEGQPDTEMPQLNISTGWGGASPEVVQVFLTSPIEEASAQVRGLEEMTSSSTRGSSSVNLKFNRDTDMEFARLELNERLSNIRANLPAGAQQPIVSMTERDDTSNDNFMTFDISGPYDLARLSELFDDHIRDEITSVDGVADLYIYGRREKSLKIKLKREAMELYGLIPDYVVRKISELTEIYDTPRANWNNLEYTITIANSIPSIHEVEDLTLFTYGDQQIRVRDVSEVTLGQARVRSLSRLNGNPTIRVRIEKEVGASVVQTAQDVRAKVAAALQTMPPGFRLDWDFDEGEMMEEQLSSIYERAGWCVVLIVVLLLIFLQSGSAALVITLNILFSVVITVNFMYYFDVTFNVVTLSGLAIGFGMLVDNAIVVLENIFRHREMGRTRIDAAIEGVREVVWAIFAATLTTVAAFLCMIFLEDRLAVTYWPLALAVIFSLSASLVVSFTFTPLLSLMIRGSNLHKKHEGKRNLVVRLVGSAIAKKTAVYGQIVLWTLRHKTLVMVFMASLLFMFIQIFRTEIDSGGFSFWFSQQDRLGVAVRMPEGAELETADEVIKQFENPVLQIREDGSFKDMSVNVYDTFAIMRISFDQDTLASPVPLALKSKLIGIAQGFAGVGLSVFGISNDDNYYSGNTGFETYNSNIRLMGYNYKRLMEYSEHVIRGVKRNRRVKSTKLETSRRSRTGDQTETVLVVERDALRRYNIDISYFMQFLARNLRQESTRTTKFRGEEVVLEVKFEDADVFDIKDLEELVIRTEDGQRIRLSDLVNITERTVPGGIDRKDQQYMVNIKWDYKGSPKRARTFNESVFNSLELPPGFKAELEYTEFLSQEETDNLGFVIKLAALIVFMIIAALYESFIDPLVIFLTIPFSFIGVSWIYWYTGNSFDSTAYIGLVILAGIVVNNSILLVSHINHEVGRMDESGLSFHQAVAKACMDRLRPILLTAITTIVGLLPLLDEFVTWFIHFPVTSWSLDAFNAVVAMLGSDYRIVFEAASAENQGLQTTLSMFSSLSRSTVGGMLSATLSTLFVIPVVYTIFFRGKQWLHTRIEEVFNVTRGSDPEAQLD